jgi:transposase
MLYTGLDIHKNRIYGTVMKKDGTILEQKEFVNCKEELQDFICGRPTKVLIEACGFWMDTYDKLKEMSCDVVLAHPGKVEAIASAKMKTDKIDSEILAHLLRSNLIPEAWAPDKATREKRELVRFRSYLIRNRIRYKSKIKFIMLKKGLRYPQSMWKGKHRIEAEKIDPKIAAYFRMIDKINEEVAIVDKQVALGRTKDKQIQLLTSIYGISDYAATTIMAEIGDFSRFSTTKKLKSYSGLVPSVYQSGDKCRMGHITRQGSRWLRWILVQCCHVAVKKKDSKLGKYYARLCKNKNKKVAMVATACKMLEIIYAILRDNKPYDSL